MAIPDLLWACPSCGLDRGLRDGPGPDTCAGCGLRYDRVRGSRIRASRAGAPDRVLTAAEWVDLLPHPRTLLKGRNPIRRADVTVRFVDRHEVVRERGRYLNRIELFGDERKGTLELAPEALRFDEPGRDPTDWPFDDLKAVQASSRTLQLRGGDHPLASFAFRDDSSFLWEQLVTLLLRDFYRRTGKGEIVELQPRITVR